MFARRYFVLAMIVLSLHLGGCFPAFVFLAAPAEAWYITFDFLPDPIISRPFSFHEKGNADEFAVEIEDMQTYELALLTEEEIFHVDLVRRKPLEWEIEISIWHDGELVDRQLMGPIKWAGIFYDKDKSIDYRKRISLGHLPALKSSLFWSKTYTVRLEVKKADERFNDPDLPARIVIQRSYRL